MPIGIPQRACKSRPAIQGPTTSSQHLTRLATWLAGRISTDSAHFGGDGKSLLIRPKLGTLTVR